MRHPIDIDYVSKAIVGIASPVLGEATAKVLVAKLWKLETLPDVMNSLA